MASHPRPDPDFDSEPREPSATPSPDPAPSCPWPSHRIPWNLELVESGDEPCSYLPGRSARIRGFMASSFPADAYHELMDAGFRRSGPVLYQPVCRGCRECMQIRVPTERFRPARDQRRCLRGNFDVTVEIGAPRPTREKHEIYLRYLEQRHDGSMSGEWEGFVKFLYRSPVDTVEFVYRDPSGRILGAGICDVCSLSLSSVYFYFDPRDARRRPGVLSALHEIDFCREAGIPYYYLGYRVRGCRAMEYKTRYRPCELLHADGVWREFREEDDDGT